jgi:4-hydroxy-3-methylbut-2-enyl diphosphate reductase
MSESTPEMSRPALEILIASPRGFCAGVDRAIQIVELALKKYGRPVYVRHEIVHNRFVVERLEQMGAVFVEELDAVPDDAPVVFSAHGVPKSVPAEARRRGLRSLDATCPLVSKVHREAEHHHKVGRHVILIGHAGHPEVVGTTGQLPPGAVSLIETVADAERFAPPAAEAGGAGGAGAALAYTTQTTLSVDDVAEIVAVLRRRFPAIHGPRKEDICFATTNRQAAVKAIAEQSDLVLIIGAPNSSNSMRLVEVARKAGRRAALIQRARDLATIDFAGVARLGLSAGASAPEVLVDEVIGALGQRFAVTTRQIKTIDEDVLFKVPTSLRKA